MMRLLCHCPVPVSQIESLARPALAFTLEPVPLDIGGLLPRHVSHLLLYIHEASGLPG